MWWVQTWKPARFGRSKLGNLHVLGGPNLETCTFRGVQTWKPARTCTFRGVQIWEPARLGGPNRETSTFWGVQTWKPAAGFQVLDPPKRAGFQVWTPETCRFPGLDLPNVQVFRFGSPKTCRFPGLDPPNVQVCRFAGLDTPKTCRFPGLDPQKNVQVPPKTCRLRASFQVQTRVQVSGVQTWKPARLGGPNLEKGPWKPARFPNPKLNVWVWGVQTWKPARFGGSKPGNLHVWGGPNLETCTFWGVQTWKPARFRGPNLETCTFGGSKPGNLPSRKSFGVETYQKGPEHEGFGVFRAFGFSGTEPNRTECAQNR